PFTKQALFASVNHFRSRTPAAEFRYGEQTRATPLPLVSPRSKTPAPVPGGRHEAESTTMQPNRAQTLQRVRL
ncbi:unnamed protein product, partial [Strongylus vulgaris]